MGCFSKNASRRSPALNFNEMRSLSRLNPGGAKQEQSLSLQKTSRQRSNQLLNIIAGLGEWHLYAENDER